jgi:hypothetical protein
MVALRSPDVGPTALKDAHFSRLFRFCWALFFSSLFHLLVIFFAYFGQSPDRESNVADRRVVFSATLDHSIRHDQPAHAESVAAARLESIVERGIGAPGRSPTGQFEVTQGWTAAEGVDVLPIEGVVYFATHELSVKPQPLAEAVLDPVELSAIIVSGRMLLALWINEFGEVSDVSAEYSDLPDIFLENAVKAFRKLRFTPGELNGQKVKSVMRIELNYDDSRAREP